MQIVHILYNCFSTPYYRPFQKYHHSKATFVVKYRWLLMTSMSVRGPIRWIIVVFMTRALPVPHLSVDIFLPTGALVSRNEYFNASRICFEILLPKIRSVPNIYYLLACFSLRSWLGLPRHNKRTKANESPTPQTATTTRPRPYYFRRSNS